MGYFNFFFEISIFVDNRKMKLQLLLLAMFSLFGEFMVHSHFANKRSLPPVLSNSFGTASGSSMFNLLSELEHGHHSKIENALLEAAVLRQIKLVIPRNIDSFNKAGRANPKKQSEILKQLLKILDVTTQKMTKDLEHMHAYKPQNQHGQNPYGQNPYGQNPYGQNPYGQNPYGQNPYGQYPYGQYPYGQYPYGQNQYGQNQYGQNPYRYKFGFWGWILLL